MIRKLIFVLGALLIMVLTPLSVSARRAFCSSDPIYEVGGHRIQVIVALLPEEAASRITTDNPMCVHLAAPKGTNPTVVWVEEEPPQVATASEERLLDRSLTVTVRVPLSVVNLWVTRVTVYKDGELVGQWNDLSHLMTVRLPL